jgi:hypothetical protein
MPFTEIDNGIKGDGRSQKFMVAVDTFQCRDIQHPTIVEDFMPHLTGDGFQPIESPVNKQENMTALGTGIEQFFNRVFIAASQTSIPEVSCQLRNQEWLNILGEIIDFHGSIVFMLPIYG